MDFENCKSITLFKGSDGRTIYNGSGAPTLTTANAGDFYIDTTAWEIYGPYTGSSWGTGTSLIGATGATGANGTNGTNGTDGAQGNYGGWSSQWQYDSNTGTSTGNGEFRFNNADPGSATELYVNKINSDSVDFTTFLTAWQNSGAFGLVRISKLDNTNVFWMGILTDYSLGATEGQFPVTTVLSNGTFTDGDEFVVSFVRNGQQGVQGTPGTNGDDVGLASMFSDATQIVNSVAETSLLTGLISGNFNISANEMVAGNVYQIEAHGRLNVGTTVNLNMRWKTGVGTVCDSGAIVMPNVGDKYWSLKATMTVRTSGVTGTVQVSGEFKFHTNVGGTSESHEFTNTFTTLNTTVPQSWLLTAQYSAADPSNTLDCDTVVFTQIK